MIDCPRFSPLYKKNSVSSVPLWLKVIFLVTVRSVCGHRVVDRQKNPDV
jgi:hypothetical protein